MGGYRDYLSEQSIPDRIAALGLPLLPLLVIFGEDDRRWVPSSASAYRDVPGARVELLPGVGHTPMIEDPQRAATLLLDFAAVANPS
jgi:pimeloyl-ACP methyl ester carboxylesterase